MCGCLQDQLEGFFDKFLGPNRSDRNIVQEEETSEVEQRTAAAPQQQHRSRRIRLAQQRNVAFAFHKSYGHSLLSPAHAFAIMSDVCASADR